MIKVLQIATTYGQQCGVGNFARRAEEALSRAGVRIQTSTELALDARADVILLHHEWGLFPSDDTVHRFCSSVERPVVMFSHSPGTEGFAPVVAGFVVMCQGVVGRTGKPVFMFPHPAWTPERLAERGELKSRFGLADKSIVIGSSGFLLPRREFPEVLAQLLPAAAENDWFVDLVTSRWMRPVSSVEPRLDHLLKEYPRNFRYGKTFLTNEQLNLRLQACDLLWCWTSKDTGPYASGVVSDQYASGTRSVVADKRQHRHITTLPNAVRAPASRPEFVDAVIAEARTEQFPRHDPDLVSWRHWSARLIGFLATLA